jgi:hypothetical protein
MESIDVEKQDTIKHLEVSEDPSDGEKSLTNGEDGKITLKTKLAVLVRDQTQEPNDVAVANAKCKALIMMYESYLFTLIM